MGDLYLDSIKYNPANRKHIDEPGLEPKKKTSRKTYNLVKLEAGTESQKYPWLDEVRYPLVVRSEEFFTNIKRCRGIDIETCFSGRFALGGVVFKNVSEDDKNLLYGKEKKPSIKQSYDISYSPVRLAMSSNGTSHSLSLSLVPAKLTASQLIIDSGKKGEDKKWFTRLEVAKFNLKGGVNFWTKHIKFWSGVSGDFSVLVPPNKLAMENPVSNWVEKNTKLSKEDRQGKFERLRYAISFHPEISITTVSLSRFSFLVGLGGFYGLDEIAPTDSGKIIKAIADESSANYYGASATFEAAVSLGGRNSFDLKAVGYYGNKSGIDFSSGFNIDACGNKLRLFFKASYIEWGIDESDDKISNTRIGGGAEMAIWWGDT